MTQDGNAILDSLAEASRYANADPDPGQTGYAVGDLVRYRTYGGSLRTVRILAVTPSIESTGKPGFDGVCIAGREDGMPCWGYASQIVTIEKGADHA